MDPLVAIYLRVVDDPAAARVGYLTGLMDLELLLATPFGQVIGRDSLRQPPDRLDAMACCYD